MEQETTGVMSEVAGAAQDAVEETVVSVTSKFVDFIKTYATWHNLFKCIGALVMILIMILVYKLIKHLVKKIPEEKLQPHYNAIILRFIKYVFYILVVMYVLSLFGVKLSAIWGAAGIAGVAIGFAAQTSVSNLISGLFVLGEKTMKIGDYIEVGGVSGTVDYVGLLSVKVHTLDNLVVRIPNSTIINSNLQNNSYNKERRVTFSVSIDYDSDMDKALAALRTVPAMCPSILTTPAPDCWYDGFGDSGINMTIAVWFSPSKAGLGQVKNEIYTGMKKAFDDAGINIPFNRLDVAMVK